MATGYGKSTIYDNASQITGPTGWYKINTSSGRAYPFYLDQGYDGGGWVLVMANRRYTSGMNNLKFNDAMNVPNYRHNGTDDATNDQGIGPTSTLANFNAWIGLNFWSELAGRATASTITVVQYTAATDGVALSSTGSHAQRIRFTGTGFNSTTGAFQGKSGTATLELDTNGWGNSGFYNMMGNPLSTYDQDNDTNGGNCSTYYNNQPFFYTSCWTGNIFAGGSYVDGPYWVSSVSPYPQQYCGVYIK